MIRRAGFTGLLVVMSFVLAACFGGVPTPPSEPITIVVTPERHGVSLEGIDQSVQLTADVTGGDSNTTITWAVDSNGGTLSDSEGTTVTWTAPNAPGEYQITAMATSGSRTVTATIPLGAYNRCDSGNGTAASPCVISTVYQLQAINDFLEGHFQLGGDIEASVTKHWNSGAGFDPIGPVPVNPGQTVFEGTFDGDDHQIIGLYINRPDQDYVGLFSSFTGNPSGAMIRNLGLVDGEIVGGNYVGALVGRSWGLASAIPGPIIEHVYNTGSVTSTGNWVGGIAGNNGYSSVIRYAYNTGAVKGVNNVGGIAGTQTNSQNFAEPGSIRQSYNTGSIQGESNVGGVVGNASYPYIRQVYNTGSVNGTENVGGLVGSLTTSGSGLHAQTLEDAYNMGPVTGDKVVGGVVGRSSPSNYKFHQLYNTGQVTGDERVGALVADTLNLPNSYYLEGTGPQTSSGHAKTPAEMKQSATYDGWDFVAVWEIHEGADYPELKEVPR